MKKSEDKFGKFASLMLILVIVMLSLYRFVMRELWFDEALTLINFVALPSVADIYRNYVIPNNQIVHSVLVRFWVPVADRAGDFIIALRAFPFACSLLFAGLFFGAFCRKFGRWITVLVLAAAVTSASFQIYGTAIRGYMLSAVLLVVAVAAALRWVQGGKWYWGGIYFVSSLVAVGTIPTNLAPLLAVGIYAAPECGRDFYRRKRFWMLFLLPVAAMLLFYLPISRQLLKCAALGEGWHDRAGAVAATFMAAGAAGGAVLAAALGGYFLVLKRWSSCSVATRWRTLRYPVIALIPVVGCMVFKVAPFPRTFFPFLVFLLLFCGEYLQRGAAFERWRGHRRRFLLIVSVLAGVVALGGNMLSLTWAERKDYAGGEYDDYFMPYYMRSDFLPSSVWIGLRRREFSQVYMSFRSDPWALMLSGILSGRRGCEYLFDGPRGRIVRLLHGSPVILRRDEDPKSIEVRFGGRLMLAGHVGRNSVYLLDKSLEKELFGKKYPENQQ